MIKLSFLKKSGARTHLLHHYQFGWVILASACLIYIVSMMVGFEGADADQEANFTSGASQRVSSSEFNSHQQNMSSGRAQQNKQGFYYQPESSSYIRSNSSVNVKNADSETEKPADLKIIPDSENEKPVVSRASYAISAEESRQQQENKRQQATEAENQLKKNTVKLQYFKIGAQGEVEPRQDTSSSIASGQQYFTGYVEGEDKAPSDQPEKQAALQNQTGTGKTTEISADPHKQFGVRIAKAASVDDIKAHWSKFLTRHPKQLKGLTPLVLAEKKGNKQDFQLIAGPFSNVAKAVEVCSVVKNKSDCQLTFYKGNRF